ncbi:MAG: serine/threonine protein kinase, partial [Phycisphaerales bacterium]|nr:serine/threonine protein kinase [Phycisphaerales bacterium]
MIAGDRPMCLGQDELERIATDAAAGGDSLAHLEHCADCRAAIDRIRAERALFSELVGAVREGSAVPQRPAAVIEIPGYTIYAELCRGGQGIVYRALQQSTRREVAVKVMRDGPFSGRADRARFEREVELLAQLEHPNIVAIHDSGMAAGFFYFVMDLVRGVTLDEFIAGRDAAQASRSRAAHGASSANRAERRLPLSRAEVTLRLRLFATICDAVNAAHLRGVIHRDLKPANVLVDERGTPHVLDFGLARAAARSDASLTITRTGFFVGTPLWAAPEQLDDQTGRSDLRSDVYSLGVMLYQMLTGAWPYGEARSLPEIVTAVRDVDPISPRRVRAGLDDDIETIILKCLEKDPARRYETAGAVARDVLRYLAGNAIDARRDSNWYVFRKSLNRHRRTVTATTLIAAALLIGGAMAVNGAIESRTAQAREGYERARVASERAKAEAITQIAREMFPTGDRNTLVSTPQFIALQNLTKRMDTGLLQGRPEVEIAVRTSIAEIYRERGLTRFSEQELRQAHRLSVLSFGQRHATTAACADVLAEMLLRRNSALEAERHCRAALDVRREVLGPEHVDVARSLETLARIELAMGRSSDALKSAANALRIRRNTFGDEHVDVAASHETIAAIGLFDGASAAASAELCGLGVRLDGVGDGCGWSGRCGPTPSSVPRAFRGTSSSMHA